VSNYSMWRLKELIEHDWLPCLAKKGVTQCPCSRSQTVGPDSRDLNFSCNDGGKNLDMCDTKD
jgi:hypothetical protein